MTDAHYLEAPPGSYVNLPMAILAPIMLYLSMRTRGEKAPTSEGEASRA
jgi:hypothetical protein